MKLASAQGRRRHFSRSNGACSCATTMNSLVRLTKAQHNLMFEAFDTDKNMQLYDRGIR